MSEESNELTVQDGDKKIGVKGTNVLWGINIVALTLLCYGGYQHTVDAKEEGRAQRQEISDNAKMQVGAINANTQAAREMAGEMRVANCLATLTMEQKKSPEMIAFCKSLASIR